MPAASRPRIPITLNRYLGTPAAGGIVGIADYVERGAALVTPRALTGLRSLRAALMRKIARVEEGTRLRRRLDCLAQFVEESKGAAAAAHPAVRECAFALLYFLKGFDRIPDDIPEVGLVDDAMVVQAAILRHGSALKGHWMRAGRPWPEDL